MKNRVLYSKVAVCVSFIWWMQDNKKPLNKIQVCIAANIRRADVLIYHVFKKNYTDRIIVKLIIKTK